MQGRDSPSNEFASQKQVVTTEEMKQIEEQIQKAVDNHDSEVVAIMKEVRKMLIRMGGAV